MKVGVGEGLENEQSQTRGEEGSKFGHLEQTYFLNVPFFKAMLVIASPGISSSNKQPKYSTTERCLITFLFRVVFNERSDLFPLLNKILLVLSSPKCIEFAIYEPSTKVVKIII